MNTQLSTKFAALGVALMMNGLLIGGVAYLFNSQIRQAPVLAVTHATVSAGQATG